MPVAFVCFLVRGIYGGGRWSIVTLKALLLEGEKVGDPVRSCAIGSSRRAAVGSLEYVMAWWLRSRRLTVVFVCAGRGCGGRRPRPLPHQRGELGPQEWWVVGAWVGVVGGGLGSTPGGVPRCTWCPCGPCCPG